MCCIVCSNTIMRVISADTTGNNRTNMTSCQTLAVPQTVGNIWSIQSVSDPANTLPVQTASCTKTCSIHGAPQFIFSSMTDGRWSLLFIIAQSYWQQRGLGRLIIQDTSVENCINITFLSPANRQCSSNQASEFLSSDSWLGYELSTIFFFLCFFLSLTSSTYSL